MRWLHEHYLRWRALLKRRQLDCDLDDEIRFHLEMRAERNRASGMTSRDARDAAQRQFGNPVLRKESIREMWSWGTVESVFKDAQYATRALRRTPGFTAVAVLTLALGIGANTAIFSVVKGVMLEPLPYNDADRIVAVRTLWTKTSRTSNISGGDYPDLVAAPSPFAAVSRYMGGELAVETNGQGEFVAAYGVDAGFADVFQVTPVVGRLITAEEYKTKASLAMVSVGFAARHFGSAANALGKAVNIENRAMPIVGVLPERFHFPLKADVWFPIHWENTNRTAHNYRVVALLKPDVTPETARAHLSTVGDRLQRAFPSSHKDKSFTATPLKDLMVERSRMTLWLLMGAVGLVLLVACVNVANLLLARATTRSREMALRAALGAGRRRLMRQVLVESALLGVMGGVAGLVLAYAGVDALVRLAGANLPRLDEIRVDRATLGFNLVISLGAALLAGLWPAIRSARTDLNDALKQGGARGTMGGGRGEWVRGALVSAEIALALVLTLGAGLLFRSFLALNAVDLGYQTEGRLVLTVSIPAKTEEDHLQAGATFERIFTALRELPGVSAAAGAMGLPSGPYGSNGLYAVEGMHNLDSGEFDKLPQAGFRLSSPGYFAAMGVPLLEGRDFNERDLYDAEPVVMVSAALVRQVFHGESPIGRRIKCGLDRDVWMRVVGIVGDVRNDGPATPAGPELYMPYRQHPFHANDLHIVVRAQSDVATAAVKTVAQISPTIPVKVSTLEQFHSDSVALPRFRTLLLIVFAGLAATLATAGVYGVMSYAAAQRQAEMGVRVALGASGGDIVATLTGNAVRLTVTGLAAGLLIAFAAGRLVETMLYGVRPYDPLTIGAAILLLSGAALIAALIPALRASRVDPVTALRQE